MGKCCGQVPLPSLPFPRPLYTLPTPPYPRPQSVRGSAAKKTDTLRALFSPSGQCADMCHLSCPCPLDPSVLLVGVVTEHCAVFKSALTPLRLAFRALLPEGGDGATAAAAGTAGAAAGMPGEGPLQQPSAATASEGWEVAERLPSLTLGSPAVSRRPSGAGSGIGGGGGGGTISPQHLSRRTSSAGGAGAAAGEGSGGLGSPAGSRASLSRANTETLLRQASVPPAAPAPPTTLVTLIYKKGDDLRQDQLVVQLFSLMDRWVGVRGRGV